MNKKNIWSFEACVGVGVVAAFIGLIVLAVVFCSCNEDKPCPEPQGQTKVTQVNLAPVMSEIKDVKTSLAIISIDQYANTEVIKNEIESLDSNMQKMHKEESAGTDLGIVLLIIMASVAGLCGVFAVFAIMRKEPIVVDKAGLLAKISLVDSEIMDRKIAMNIAYVETSEKKRKLTVDFDKHDTKDPTISGSIVALDQVYNTSVDAYLMANDRLCRLILTSPYLIKKLRYRYERQLSTLIREYPNEATGISTPYSSIDDLIKVWQKW